MPKTKTKNLPYFFTGKNEKSKLWLKKSTRFAHKKYTQLFKIILAKKIFQQNQKLKNLKKYKKSKKSDTLPPSHKKCAKKNKICIILKKEDFMKNYNTYIYKAIFAVLTCFCFGVVCAGEEEAKIITLKAPQLDLGLPVMQALNQRKSVREYSDKEIDLQTLSNLLWAANGVNRSDGKRTAPSAMNRQEIEIYVCQKDGAYHYQAAENILKQVSTEDCRLRNAPITLILVSDTTKAPNIPGVKDWGLIDGGIVSQNISLFASGMGLATVPQGSMPREKFTKILKLKKGFNLVLNHPIGYPKEEQELPSTTETK